MRVDVWKEWPQSLELRADVRDPPVSHLERDYLVVTRCLHWQRCAALVAGSEASDHVVMLPAERHDANPQCRPQNHTQDASRDPSHSGWVGLRRGIRNPSEDRCSRQGPPHAEGRSEQRRRLGVLILQK